MEWIMESSLFMRLGYNSLAITILLVCIWFSHVSTKKAAYYRQVMNVIMWLGVALFIVRDISVMMDEGVIEATDRFVYFERTAHYALSTAIYSTYFFLICCIVDHMQYIKKKTGIMFGIPGAITVLIILTTPFTGWMVTVNDGVASNGPLYFIIMVIRDSFAVAATVRAIQRRHVFPTIFEKSAIALALITVLQFLIYMITFDDTIYFTATMLCILIMTMTIGVIDFYVDSLTGLLDKEAFVEYIDKEIAHRSSKALYFIKIKNFEYLEENCYESYLNDIIIQIADCLKEYSGKSAIYYIGDGKYIIIVNKRDKLDEEQLLNSLESLTVVPFELNGARVQLGIFVAIMKLGGEKFNSENFRRYFKACDEMRGRNDELLEVVRGDNTGIDELHRYHQVEDAIDRALMEKEFRMFYQPIVDARTQKVVSAEALIRLNDRVLGFVSPEEFIPISENNGKILDISEFVLDSVFKFVSEHDLDYLGMHFVEMNLSVMQCMDKNLENKLKYYIDKYKVDPCKINLEITETATNFDEKELKKQLECIKKLGFTFSLDDYGTGYSNLVRVLDYPVDLIKLDKSIVWGAFHDQDSFVTLKNLIAMFHDVRRKLVAEGVESEEQMKALCELECDYFQGYYYSKPIDQVAFVQFVKKHNNNFKI